MNGTAIGFHVAGEAQDRADDFTVAPEREAVAVGVQQVGQRAEALPLRLVVPIAEPTRIGALAGRLNLDEADQCLAHLDGEVRSRLEVGRRKLRRPA